MDTLTKLRAWWFHRQGLDAPDHAKTPAEILSQTGWARSVAGASPYLGLFVRCGASRDAVDAAVAQLEIHELPAARGCTYIVPAADYALALKAGEGASTTGDMNVARKLGVTDQEIDKLCAAVLTALKAQPLDPAELKDALGGAVRNLGEEGKKKGVTTTLPLALGRLQEDGEIRRIPTNGRLDNQRYRYALWRPNPRAGWKLTREETLTELARRYFGWAGPATAVDFQTFSGLGVGASKKTLAPLELVDTGEGRLILKQNLAAFEAHQPPKTPLIAMPGSIDCMVLLRKEKDLPSHAIVDRGSVIGLWEYDPETATIAWSLSEKPSAALKKAVTDAVKITEAYVRDQLGDARSFSLDSPKSRAPRIAALRATGIR